MHRSSHHGFTIVELLIVIVVVAIIAAIVLVSYSGIQARAQATAISSGLQQVDRSMHLWAAYNKFLTWPSEPVAGGGIPLSQLIADNSTLQQYLQQVPEVQGIHTDEWFYDNDGSAKTECAQPYDGVNIVIRFVENASVAQQVDSMVDDGDINCGQVRYVDQRIFYALSYTQTVE